MSKKNCAHRVVALITILMLSLAPVTFAGDGTPSILSTLDSIVESISDALDDLFGGTPDSGDEEDGEGEDEGLPDFGPFVDPNG